MSGRYLKTFKISAIHFRISAPRVQTSGRYPKRRCRYLKIEFHRFYPGLYHLSQVSTGLPEAPPPSSRANLSKSRWVLLRGPLSPYSPGIYKCCPHIFAPPWTTPLGSQDCPLGSWNCLLGTSRCTFVHLAHLQMHFCASGSPICASGSPICASGSPICASGFARRDAEGPIRYERAAH